MTMRGSKSTRELTGTPEENVYRDPDGRWYTTHTHHSFPNKFAAMSAVHKFRGLPPLDDDDIPMDEDEQRAFDAEIFGDDDEADAWEDDNQQVVYDGKTYTISNAGYEVGGHYNTFTAYSVYRGPHYLGKVFHGADDKWYAEPGPSTGLTYSNPAIAAIQNNVDRLYAIGDMERAKEGLVTGGYEDIKPPEPSRLRGGGIPKAKSARPRIRN